MRFKDKVALITAVGSGIGRATADIMAAEGAVIIGVDNDERRLAMAMEAMNMSGGRAIGRPCNALDEAEVNERGWHAWRSRLTLDSIPLPSRDQIRDFAGDASLDPSEPWKAHWLEGVVLGDGPRENGPG